MNLTSLYSDRLSLCEKKLGYSFAVKLRCATSLNAGAGNVATFVENGRSHPIPRNDRMAVYGDAATSERLARLWLDRKLSKGQWTEIRNRSLSNASLAEVGFRHGFHTCIVPNPGTVQVSTAMMATAMEALLGAVSVDGKAGALDRVMARLGLTEGLLDEALFASAPKCPFVMAPAASFIFRGTTRPILPEDECHWPLPWRTQLCY